MGLRGPKPKPTAVRVFEGDPGRLLPRRQGEVMPGIAEDCPAAPEWLGDVGKAIWAEVAPSLHRIGCLSVNDERLLALYCDAWEDFFEARNSLAEDGKVATTDKGSMLAHPMVKQKRDAMTTIKQIGGEFGMSPSARVGLNLPQSKENSLEKFKRIG